MAKAKRRGKGAAKRKKTAAVSAEPVANVTAADPLETLRRREMTIRDRVRGVTHGESNGMYVHGRAGTSKTYTVRTTLEAEDVPHHVQNGHLTPRATFDVLRDHRGEIVVLDDVTSILESPIALQILLAALGSPHDGSRKRLVTYTTAKGDERFYFTGGVILLSNLDLAGHHGPVLSALRDRVHVLEYAPTYEEIVAKIRDIAAAGVRGVSANDAATVAEYVIDRCHAYQVCPSLRIFVDKAIGDYKLWKGGRTELHWQDLVSSTVQAAAVPPNHEPRDISRISTMDRERRVALDIIRSGFVGEAAIEQWTQRTGKVRDAYYRRRRELVKSGDVAQ